jgi:hypothetical protein
LIRDSADFRLPTRKSQRLEKVVRCAAGFSQRVATFSNKTTHQKCSGLDGTSCRRNPPIHWRTRSPKGESDGLEQAFCLMSQELGIIGQIDFHLRVLGFARPLFVDIRDEIYRIGREASINAFRHSHATCIEVELEYGTSRFRLIVRDNGCGIDSQVLRSGNDGHWGLSGMRERAERMGARLKIWSRAAAGTEVELTVSNRIAFASKPA